MGGPEAARVGLLDRAARALAIAGGVLLVAAMAVTVASVGRAAFGRAILGDTELVELLVGVAIAWFMPWCQARRAHVRLEVFTARAPEPVRRALDRAAGLMVALVVALLAWRLIQGGLDAHERGRQTMFLELPLWWGYAAAAIGMVLWTMIALAQSVARLDPAPSTPRP